MSESTDQAHTADTLDVDDEFSLKLDKKKKKKPKKADDQPDSSPAAPGGATTSLATSSTSTSSLSSSSSIPSSTALTAPSLSSSVVESDYTYTELLERVYSSLHANNPNLATRKRHVMPPPQLARIGTRKTMWGNFAQAAQVMRRQPEHLMQFLLAELGTEGSIDGNQRLVIRGRFQSKQIESLLKKYIVEYVTCHMCRNPDTGLSRDSVTRLYFLQCENCGSRRSVAPIKTGFHAVSRSDRRKNQS